MSSEFFIFYLVKLNILVAKLPASSSAVIFNFVIIKNPIKRKNYASPTSRIGLNNLDNRYKLITKRNIIVENNFRFFTVKLPILKF